MIREEGQIRVMTAQYKQRIRESKVWEKERRKEEGFRKAAFKEEKSRCSEYGEFEEVTKGRLKKKNGFKTVWRWIRELGDC